MPLDMPPSLPEQPVLELRAVDVEYEFQDAARFLGSDPDEVTFTKGDVDVHIGVEFSGASYDPLTIFSAFLAWIQIRGDFDIGVANGEDVSVGLGAEVFFGRPYFHQSIVEWRTTDQEPIEWQALETGFIPRLTLHVQELSYVDIYALIFFGPTYGQVDGKLNIREASTRYQSWGLRGGIGVGGNLVAKYGILLGGELRYQVGARLTKGEDLELLNGQMEVVGVTDIERHQRAPRGFSWVFNIGKRF